MLLDLLPIDIVVVTPSPKMPTIKIKVHYYYID